MNLRAHSRNGYRTLLSLGVNALLFGAALLLLHPVYGTVEDVFLLYQLSGGFGDAPTELLHYNHILNPLLGLPLKALFLAAPSVNWYSVALLAGHFAACTIILSCLLRRYSIAWSILFFCLFFFVFECRSIESCNFSNTSLTLALGGLILFLSEGRKDRPRSWVYSVAFFAVIAAALFRIHAWLPLLPLLAPLGLLLPTWKRRLHVAGWIGAALLATLLLHRFQERYYTRNLPAWQAEEAYRQHVYAFYNHHNVRYPVAGQPMFLEGRMLRHGFVADRALLTEPVMKEVFETARRAPGASAWPLNRWSLINNKIYLASLLLLLLLRGRPKEHVLWGISTAIGFLLWLVLVLYFAKMPDYLLQGMIAALLLGALCTRAKGKPFVRWLPAVPLLLAAWGLWMQLKLDAGQQQRSARFEAGYREIAAQPRNLYFVSTDRFLLQELPFWTIPAQKPLTNFLSGEHFLQGLDASVLRRFRIRNVRELAAHPEVRFAGWPPELLQDYYERVTGLPFKFQPSDTSGSLLQPYRLVPSIEP